MSTEPTRFDKLPPDAEERAVRAVLAGISEDPEVRRTVLGILADTIEAARAHSPTIWSLSYGGGTIRLNVGRAENTVLYPGKLYFLANADRVPDSLVDEVRARGKVVAKGGYATVPNALGLLIPVEDAAELYPLAQEAHRAAIDDAARGVRATPYRRAHSRALVAALGEIVGRRLPDPDLEAGETSPPVPEIQPMALVQRTLSAAGLRYDPWDIARFYTALQAKGFVILSGITGTGKTRLVQHLAGLLPDDDAGGNCLFLSVRPDWRDVKSLTGYYNPLTQRWEWTPFLHFVARAAESYRRGDGLARFVVLDEMNLAHVEHYFADILSIMESGRTEDGFTAEPLRLVYPDDAEGELPPREIHLPPNLYVVGTVNMDETTYAFSPKVLDRAFTIELSHVDFADYPPRPGGAGSGEAGPEQGDSDAPGAAGRPTAGERAALLDRFCRGGRHARIDKAEIYDFVRRHPEVRTWLVNMNSALEPAGLHVGYRVFDEVVAFLAAAEENGMWVGTSGATVTADDGDPLPAADAAADEALRAAFDAAVSMKVLPRLHGSRGRLESALLHLRAWGAQPAVMPVAPDEVTLADSPISEPAQLPRTAERLQQIIEALVRDGFTSE